MKDGHKSGLRPAASHCKIKPMKRGNHNMTAHPLFKTIYNLTQSFYYVLHITQIKSHKMRTIVLV